MNCELCGEEMREVIDERGEARTEFTTTIDIGLYEAGYYHPSCLKRTLKAAWKLVPRPAAGHSKDKEE